MKVPCSYATSYLTCSSIERCAKFLKCGKGILLSRLRNYLLLPFSHSSGGDDISNTHAKRHLERLQIAKMSQQDLAKRSVTTLAAVVFADARPQTHSFALSNEKETMTRRLRCVI